MLDKARHIILFAGLLLVLISNRARAQESTMPDSVSGYFQEYFSQLIEEWRLNQIQELAKQWGITVVGPRGIKMNRSFWEERLSLVMWLPRSNRGQTLTLEYQLNKRFLLRGEANRHSSSDNAWLDLIFRTEY